MNEKDMETIAEFFARVLVKNEDPETVGQDVVDFRLPKQPCTTTSTTNTQRGLDLTNLF
jgi:hypothetical protein